MNCWYVAAWDYELGDGKLLDRTLLGKPVVLYKGDSGRPAALDNRCAHRGAKLSNGMAWGAGIWVGCLREGSFTALWPDFQVTTGWPAISGPEGPPPPVSAPHPAGSGAG